MNPELTSQSWVGGASGLKSDRAQPVSGCPSLHSGLEAPPHPASRDHSKSGSHFDLLQIPCRVTWLGLALRESTLSLPGGDRGHCVILRTSQTQLLIHVYTNRVVAYGRAGCALHNCRRHRSPQTLGTCFYHNTHPANEKKGVALTNQNMTTVSGHVEARNLEEGAPFPRDGRQVGHRSPARPTVDVK